MLDNDKARSSLARVITPIAMKFIQFGVSPNSVTVFGALLSISVVLTLIPTGHLLLAAILYGVCGLSDLIDGTMARVTGTTSAWGAFLDSTLDRFVDAALLIGLILYFNNQEMDKSTEMIACMVALVAGQAISYIRARAESLGIQAAVGIAERAERSLIIWIALLVSGLGFDVLSLAVLLLAAVSVITVLQRFVHVRKQFKLTA